MHSCCSGQGSFPCYICSLIVYCGYSASVTGHIFTVCMCAAVCLSQVTSLQSVCVQLYVCHRSHVYSLIVHCGYSASVTGHIFTVCTLQLQLCSCHRSQVYSLYTTVTAVQLSQVTSLQSVHYSYSCTSVTGHMFTVCDTVTAVHLSQVTCL